MGGSRRRTVAAALAAAALLSTGILALDPRESADAAAAQPPPRELYARADRCATPCATLAAAETFAVDQHVALVALVVYAALDAESGPVRISVIDPSGDVRYDRFFSGAAEQKGAVEESARWPSEVGDWTLARSYAGAVGHIEVQVWGDP